MDTEEQWLGIRADLLRISVERFCPDKCNQCSENCPPILCESCGYLCVDCDKSVHSDSPFHDRLAFINGMVQPISPTTILENGTLKYTSIKNEIFPSLFL